MEKWQVGEYVKNKKEGKWLRFGENGEYVYEEEFLDEEKLGVLGVSFQKKMNLLFIVKVF